MRHTHDAFDAAILPCDEMSQSVHRLEAESTSSSLEHVLFSAGGKLAWPISADVKEVD